MKGYSRTYPKLVTGVIINSAGKATVKNSLRKKIMFEHKYLRNNPTDKKSRQRLRGLVTAARQVDKSAYPNIRKFAFDSQKEKLRTRKITGAEYLEWMLQWPFSERKQ